MLESDILEPIKLGSRPDGKGRLLLRMHKFYYPYLVNLAD